MDFELLPVVMVLAGTVLLYSAIRNKNPIGVIQTALTGGDLDSVAPLMTDPANDPPPGAVDGSTLDPGEFNPAPNGRSDPFDPGFDPDRDDVLPILPGESAGGFGAVSYRQPFTNYGTRNV